MKIVGGEIQCMNDNLFNYVTDSGRSSLRLILKSIGRRKKILLPDFLCKIIIDIVKEHNMEYSFYKVEEDLTTSFKNKGFDILYVIDYFGKKNKILQEPILDDTIVIQDSVFLPDVERIGSIKNWIGFNSFRKISSLSDGSIIKSTKKLSEDLILKQEADFVALKYKAKYMKYEYCSKNRYSQKAYLSILNQAERLLDKQKNIYAVSMKSLFGLFKFYKNLDGEYSKRRRNYNMLKRYLKDLSINIETKYPSFYILAVENREQLREYLYTKNIFLPVHWPKSEKLKNPLYQKIISIPVDSRYDEKDMEKIASLILRFLDKRYFRKPGLTEQ